MNNPRIKMSGTARTKNHGQVPAGQFYVAARVSLAEKAARIEEQERKAAANWPSRGKSNRHRDFFHAHRP